MVIDALWIAPPLLALLVNLGLLALVVKAPQKTRLYLVFALFLGSMALWALLLLGLRTAGGESVALLWQRLSLASLPLAAATYMTFLLMVTGRRATARVTLPVYGAAAALAVLALTPLVASGMEKSSYGWGMTGGPLMAPWMLLACGFFLAGAGVQALAYRKSQLADERDRDILFGLGALCAAFGIITDLLAAARLMAFPFGVYGNIGLAAFAGMAAMQRSLFSVQVAIRRGLVYLAIGLLITAAYLLVIVGLGQLVSGADGFPFYVQAVVVFVLALGFLPVARYFWDVSDRWVYGKRSDYLSLLRSIASSSQRLAELPVLARDITQAIRGAMRARNVWLLLPNQKGDFVPVVDEGPSMGAGSPALKWLQENSRPLWRSQVERNALSGKLSNEERQSIREWDVRLLVPMRSSSGLIGVMALGPRETLERYSQAEVDALFTAAQQIAIAVDNARLFSIEREQVRVLQEVDRMKTDFLGMISHQLKTPITSITTSVALLRETEPPGAPAVRGRLLGNLERSVEALRVLVNDLLDFVKLRSGRVSMNATEFAMQAVVNATLELLAPQLQARQQRVTVEMETQPVRVSGDEHRLRQVLANLLSNASAYSPAGCGISVQLTRERDEVLVSVSDACGGVPEADVPYLFEAYRMSRGRSPESAPTGSGLGLSIARALVGLHGGRIWFTNRAPEGCTFTFALPLKPAASTSAADPKDEGRKVA